MPGKLIIFWDYDTQWGADRSRSPGGPKGWGHLEFENTERLLELHAAYSLPACFAVVGAAALPGSRPYHDPDQIRCIDRMGHEIASHSMYHDWLPGLGYSRLLRTLKESKDALEQCIGKAVISFVPPFNQPFDYWKKGSLSISERREAAAGRIDLLRLMDALSETGYLFSRVSYLSLLERLVMLLFKKELDRPEVPEKIGQITCLRLNTPGGFKQKTMEMVERSGRDGNYTLVFAHPHSLHRGDAQDEKFYIPFLRRVKQLVDSGSVEVVLPRQLVESNGLA